MKPDYYESGMFENAFNKMTKGVEEHSFSHYNEAMGVKIESKEHYKQEMKKRGMVPFDETERLAKEWDKEHSQQSYDELSPKAADIISSLKMSADKHGNIQLGSRAIEALIGIGAIKPRSPYIPEGYEYAD